MHSCLVRSYREWTLDIGVEAKIRNVQFALSDGENSINKGYVVRNHSHSRNVFFF